MEKLTPLVCPQCGAPVNRERNICEYCGTQFDQTKKSGIPVLEITTTGVRVLQAQRIMTEEMIMAMGAEKASEYAMKEMAREMAKILIPMMEVKVEQDDMWFANNQRKIRARIRVVEPTYRF